MGFYLEKKLNQKKKIAYTTFFVHSWNELGQIFKDGSFATFIASGVVISNGTALRGIILILIENMRMFAL